MGLEAVRGGFAVVEWPVDARELLRLVIPRVPKLLVILALEQIHASVPQALEAPAASVKQQRNRGSGNASER